MNNLVLSPIPLAEMLECFRAIIKEEIELDKTKEMGNRLLSPAETCKLFNPSISKPTLAAWTKDGHLIQYRIKGRIFYKQDEVLNAVKHLKKYKKVL